MTEHSTTGLTDNLPAQPAEPLYKQVLSRAEAPQFPPLAYLYAEPQATANLRTQADDFIVDEELSFTPTGHGEHLLLLVEKIGQNTQYVAKQIAAAAGLKARLVSYAGLKDRHAVTRQWFCLLGRHHHFVKF